MALEIERKFLVAGDGWRATAASSSRIRQGYLARYPERTVRVRIGDEHAFLTVKGRSEGIARLEFEYEIPLTDAEQLLGLCDGAVIDKTRHLVGHAGMTWEVDEFHGPLAGLVLAECELESADQEIDLPAWVGEEVSEDHRYKNSNLSVWPLPR